MEYIYHFLAVVFGYIMNFFYIVLDAIGLPYLWVCIIVFAITSRFLFLPQKIGVARKKFFSPVINYDLKKLRERYGSINKNDSEKLSQYKEETKAIFKRYRVSSGSGCLITLVQFPIFVGLFRVVKQPFEYVPRLSHLTELEKVNVNDFFGFSLDLLPQAFGATGILIPLLVLICSLLRIWPNLFGKKAKNQPVLRIMQVLQLLLLTWMSFCMPIAISLYWVANDITNLVLTKLTERVVRNNKKNQEILSEIEVLIAAEKQEVEEKIKASAESDPEIIESNLNRNDFSDADEANAEAKK